MSEVTQTVAQETPNAAAGTSQQTPPPADASKAQTAAPQTQEAAKASSTESKGTLLTDAPKDQPGKDAVEAGKKVEAETKAAKDEKPVVPEKYDLKLPKDTALSAAHLEKLSLYAKEKGLSNEQAQAMLERENEAVSEYVSDLKVKQSEMTTQWFDQAKGDKEIGGEAFKQNVELAKRVVDKFGTDDFKRELNKTGLGNHPELLRVFSRIGKEMAEDQLVIPGVQAGGKKSIAEVLYGEAAKESGSQ